MSYRHVEQIDRAVAVARRAVSRGRLDSVETLTPFLYRRWYLDHPGSPRDAEDTERVWQVWSPSWTAELDRDVDTVRLYLSCAPHTSLHALSLVAERARGWDHPWRLASTALAHPVPALDATVLHLPLGALDDLRAPLRELLDDLRPFLAAAVPALTLRIGRGASLAQNPRGGGSFGEHRCGIVAGSVLAARHHHHREQVSRVMAAFAEAGVDPRRPYLAREGSWDRKWTAA